MNINKKKEPDQYGKDLSVQVDTWKPEPKQDQQHAPQQEDDDLPF